MCGWECAGCWRGYFGAIRGARHALNRFVIEGYLVKWFVSISRICLFHSHVNCSLSLLLLFAFRSSNRESAEGSSQALRENCPTAHLRALEVQAPQVHFHQQVWELAWAWLMPLRALSSRQCPWCPCYISSPFSGVSLDVLVVLHGVAGEQRL